MSTIGIVGTVISAALVIGIVVALTKIGRKLTPPTPQILADQVPNKLPPPEEIGGESDTESALDEAEQDSAEVERG